MTGAPPNNFPEYMQHAVKWCYYGHTHVDSSDDGGYVTRANCPKCKRNKDNKEDK